MHVQADLHVHTVASGHAFSTVAEIAREASLKGLRAVGIADHGPALPGGPHLYHFWSLRFLPEQIGPVRILRGAEANLVDARGRLDLPQEVLDTLDYALVGFHDGCGLRPMNPRKNTRALIGAMQHRGVRVLAHPGNPAFPVEVPAVVQACCELGVAVEINNASFTHSRRGSRETCGALAAQVARAGGFICLSSDAHYASQVGSVAEAWAVAAQAGVQPEQVVNRTLEGLLRFLGVPPLPQV